jgi:predicted transcriptional regulator
VITVPTTQSIEKVTFNIPSELKQEVVKLKNELNVSLNTIYKNAISEYIKKQEIKKWKKGVELATKNREYLQHSQELSDAGVEIYEYD